MKKLLPLLIVYFVLCHMIAAIALLTDWDRVDAFYTQAQITLGEINFAAKNLTLTWVAHHRAEAFPSVPLVHDVTDELIDDFGTASNSVWLLEQVRLIVPYFYYEQVAPFGSYPMAVVFAPYTDERSFHVLGSANPWYGFIYINERDLYGKEPADQADLISVLVHELIHLQGGAYLTGGAELFEPATCAATTEVLAAMCNYNDPRACKAFWKEIEDMSRSAVWLQFEEWGRGDIYQKLVNLLFRDADQERSARKSQRHWQGDPDQLRYILRAYSLRPFAIVQDGVLKGARLNTMLAEITSQGYFVIGMPFDDTTDLLGWLRYLLVKEV